MTKSALQIARAAYQPKLPKALKGAVKVKEGEPTQSVADQEAIKALFLILLMSRYWKAERRELLLNLPHG